MKKILLLLTLVLFANQTVCSQKKGPEIGDAIKSFSAIDEKGVVWKSNKAAKGKYLVVYFYPAAMTGGCTKQACAYRDDKSELDGLDAVVVGVSGDEVKNLEFFKTAHNLNFTLLSDPDGMIASLFGVPFNLGEKSIVREIDGVDQTLLRHATTSRWTFILDKKGKLIYKSSDVQAAEDSSNVIEALKANQ